MKWLKDLLWRLRNPLSFSTKDKLIKDFNEGKKKAKRYKEPKK